MLKVKVWKGERICERTSLYGEALRVENYNVPARPAIASQTSRQARLDEETSRVLKAKELVANTAYQSVVHYQHLRFCRWAISPFR